MHITPSSQVSQILTNQPRFSHNLSQLANKMFFAALSFLSLSSPFVTASPISTGINNTTHRRCGSTPTDQFVTLAEDHFTTHRVSGAEVDIPSIPVYCTLHFSQSSSRHGDADVGEFCRACNLQDHFHFRRIHPRFANLILRRCHERRLRLVWHQLLPRWYRQDPQLCLVRPGRSWQVIKPVP